MPSTSLSLRKHVILVDDEDEVRRSFSMLLGARGFDVEAYACGDDILEANEIDRRACFLLDYRLPDMNGIDLLTSLRRCGRKNPAFLITGDPLPSIRPRAKTAGFLRIIDKPVDANELAQILDEEFPDQQKFK